jgi:two-component system response regulator MprA
MSKVLIVDDDAKLLKMLQRTLAYEGLDVVTASNGQEALAQVSAHRPDVLIVDWLMPEMDGLELVECLRDQRAEVGILMLTARDAVENRVEGLESGADDYLVKPFAPTELVARVRALLRRVESHSGERILSYADLRLDPDTHEVQRAGVSLTLTPTEFRLLEYFMRHPRHVLEREQILNGVWGYDFGGDDNVLEVYVGYLRKKIETDDLSRLIQTVRGVGYVLREEG